ncbi:MAG: hypothetical protein L6R30_24910 [Thermoanaerobaculia bacterium]|nr:hypothetical protein [Thermoanaerobaculia bacterium]
MSSLLKRAFNLMAEPAGPPVLDRFVDSVVQTFENCRMGLGDEVLSGGPERVEAFFLELYEKEVPRLKRTIQEEEPLLTPAAHEQVFKKVDDLFRKVILPGYSRMAGSFSKRQQNDFYLVPENLHALERLGWGVAGILVGAFVVWAPFIPIWSKEAVLPFMIGGLLFPNIRRWLAFRGYGRNVNELVIRADQEIQRICNTYMTSGQALAEAEKETEPETARAAVRTKAQGTTL